LSPGEIAALVGGWSVIVIGLSGWLGRLLAERVLSQWRRDEQVLIETLRSDLASNRLLLETALKSQAAGHDLFQQKRLAAVERLWAGVLELRECLSSPVFFFGVLLPSEYDSALEKSDALAASVAAVTDDMILTAIIPTRQLEADRPHLGEALWFHFFIYRAFLARLAHLIVEGKRRQHISDWRDDGGVRQLLSHVIPKDTLEALLNSKHEPIAINRAIDMLESLLLKEVSLITSGRRSSFESFENAKELQAALAGVRQNGI
jgi:hypothetical protein